MDPWQTVARIKRVRIAVVILMAYMMATVDTSNTVEMIVAGILIGFSGVILFVATMFISRLD